jgi:hypothetical protein
MATPTQWQFVVHKNGANETWTWRRSGLDGTLLEVSTDVHATYGKVINDAIRHGFQPRREAWIVTDGGSITHFGPYRGKRAPGKARKPSLATRKRKSSPFRGSITGKPP